MRFRFKFDWKNFILGMMSLFVILLLPVISDFIINVVVKLRDKLPWSKKKSSVNKTEITEYDVQKMELEKKKAESEVKQNADLKKESNANIIKMLHDRISKLLKPKESNKPSSANFNEESTVVGSIDVQSGRFVSLGNQK